MNKAILHISDLHLMKVNSSYDEREIDSWIEESNEYIDVFNRNLKQELEEKKCQISLIIITGDIADIATKHEYDKAKEFLDILTETYTVSKDDIIIIPGNHDISRTKLKDYCEENNCSVEAGSLHQIKFLEFKKFYDDYYSSICRTFNPNQAISVLHKHEDMKLAIFGLNTNYKESFLKKDHIGYIDYKTLKDELDKINNEYTDYFKVAVMHHKPKILREGRGVIENWNQILNLLHDFGVQTYFYGHVHENATFTVEDDNITNYIAAGSFAKKMPPNDNSFNLLILSRQESNFLEFEPYTFHHRPKDWEQTIGNWEEYKHEKKAKSIKIFCKTKQESEHNAIPNIKPSTKPQDIIGESFKGEHKVSKEYKLNGKKEELSICSTKLVEYVCKESLFKSGHFHWGPKCRSHGWIDTNYLLGSNQILKSIVKGFINLITDNKLSSNTIIGLGMEGSIIGSLLSTVLGYKYSYYPALHRDDYNEYEKNISIKNISEIILVTDVVFSGTTINSVIMESEFFSKLEHIQLLSVFYTGRKESKQELFKDKCLPNITFYSLCDEIQINPCMYDNKHECAIYRHELDTVYEFYKEEEKVNENY